MLAAQSGRSSAAAAHNTQFALFAATFSFRYGF